MAIDKTSLKHLIIIVLWAICLFPTFLSGQETQSEIIVIQIKEASEIYKPANYRPSGNITIDVPSIIEADNLSSEYLDNKKQEIMAELAVNPTAILKSKLGEIMAMQGNYTEAIKYLEEAKNEDTTLVEPIINIGIIKFINENDYNGSSIYFQQAWDKDTTRYQTAYNLALVALANQDSSKAISCLNATLSLNPRFKDTYFLSKYFQPKSEQKTITATSKANNLKKEFLWASEQVVTEK